MNDNTAAAKPRPDYEVAAEELGALMNREGLSIAAAFVPWSASRSKDDKDASGRPSVSLNWRVTLNRSTGTEAGPGPHFKPVLATDYSAGQAHCPAYKARAVLNACRHPSVIKEALIRHECEAGRRARWSDAQACAVTGGAAILPDPVDVFASLVRDADVLQHGSFESWAEDYGYDIDSRAAERIYQACLSIALQLRAALGDALLSQANEMASRL